MSAFLFVISAKAIRTATRLASAFAHPFTSSKVQAPKQYDLRALSSPPTNTFLPITEKPLGSESTFLPFAPNPTTTSTFTPLGCPPSLDDTATKIAIAIGPNIHIYDLLPLATHSSPSPSPPLILRGHVENIQSIQFFPGSSTRLVSYADGAALGRVGQALPPGGPEMILWDTESPSVRQAITDEALDIASEAAVHTALGVLAVRASSGSAVGWGPARAPLPGLPISIEHRYTLDPAEETELRHTIRAALRKADSTTLVFSQNKIVGRPANAWQKTMFSHSGDKLVYQPGPRAASNGDAAWDICIRDVDPTVPLSSTPPHPPHKSIILKGHRDCLMWTGFSPDDTLLASVAWDKTIRVWDVSTGVERWCWRTEGQNWIGHWSPDGSQFLATCGNGTIHLWDVKTGEEVCRLKPEGRSHLYRQLAWLSPDMASSEKIERGVDLSQGLIAIGGDADGRVLILMPHPPKAGEEKKAIQDRRLSTKGMDVSEDIKSLASGFLGIKSLMFLPSPPGRENKWGIRLAFSIVVEDGVEVVDLVTGRKWRIGMRVEGQDEDEDVEMIGRASGRRIKRDEVFWKYLRRTGQILLVDSKGVRAYDLD